MQLARQIPNLLSGLRILLVPVLVWLAWTGHPTVFLASFAFSLCTDLADGFVARRMRTGSELGARLDSWGDLATYAVLPLCAWWLFRERVLDQIVFVVAAIIAFVAPTLVGLAKFRRITSYHTYLAKAVAIVMGAGLILYLGFDLPRLFQAAVLFLLVEAIEEIAITAVLHEWRANVPSFFAALRLARAARPAALVALALVCAPAGAQAQALPDLVPEVSAVQLELAATVAAGDVVEGCAAATTDRDLVRLSLTTRNAGEGAETLGDPMCPDCRTHPGEICGNPDFVCSPAGGHNHPHYRDFLRYEIVDPSGAVAAVGGKRSFCLQESMCVSGSELGRHTCSNQGLDPGCSDTYPFTLGCQYVDVTDVPDGLYTLRVTVDPLAQIAEADETNNVVEEPVLIHRDPIADTSLSGGALLFRPGDALRLRARASERTDLAGSHADPTASGASLYVSDTVSGQQIGFALPAGGWKRIGDARHPRAFRYRGDGSSDDPCRAIDVSRAGLVARCSLRGEHTDFALPAQGRIFVQLLLGAADRRFCVSFGGQTLLNTDSAVRRFGAAPADCTSGE